MIGFIELYNLQSTITHTHTIVHSHVSTSRFSVAASNGGRPPSSAFPNCPQPQLPASNSNSSQRLNRSCPVTNSPTNPPLTQLNSH
jgi:hypothetical protein